MKTGVRESIGRFLQRQVPLSRGAVLVSPFRDPYVNLALEEAIFKATVFRPVDDATHPGASPLLFMYINSPAIVLGCHQVPWREVNVPLIKRDKVTLARRHSGGGAVYHDEGNLCLSFMTHRKDYNPRANIEWLTTSLRNLAGDQEVSLTSTYRQDLFLNSKKICGSAMRLTKDNALHHCTLLVNSDLSQLKQYLTSVAPVDTFTNSSGVNSVPSPVTNLCDEIATVAERSRDDAVSYVASEITARYAALLEPNRPVFHLEEVSSTEWSTWAFDEVCSPKGTTRRFSDDLAVARQWEWIYGHAASFKQHIEARMPFRRPMNIACVMSVSSGKISGVDVTSDTPLSPNEQAVVDVLSVLVVGCRPDMVDLQSLALAFTGGLQNALLDDAVVDALGTADPSAWWLTAMEALCERAGWL